jgi:hypothetical protein
VLDPLPAFGDGERTAEEGEEEEEEDASEI